MNYMSTLSSKKLQKLIEKAFGLPYWQLNERQTCDTELLLNGAFAPLTTFLSKVDYESVVNNMRLANGSLWPIPITLDISETFAESLKIGEQIALRDPEHFAVAVLEIQEIWKPNLKKEAVQVFGTKDKTHPSVSYLHHSTHPIYVSGPLQAIELPRHIDYVEYRHTPEELRAVFQKKKWDKIISFQTRNPLHRVHIELTKRALKRNNANLLIHPVTGITKPGDIDYHTRIKCYRAALRQYPKNAVMLSLLPLAMRMAGPREALWHALIRKNYGCTHFIVGRDHASPGKDSEGKNFYPPLKAHDLLKKYSDEIGIKPIFFEEMAYSPSRKKYIFVKDRKKNEKVLSISGTQMRTLLEKGEKLDDWFTLPVVAKYLKETYPPLKDRGFTIFFTGLSGSGKTTLAKMLMVKLIEHDKRRITLLDGDIVRTHLSSELGFSKEHRSINVRRIGYVASEITKNGGIAICSVIAPYEADRVENRKLISKNGAYIEIYLSTPLEVCEHRDIKGLYLRARHNLTHAFTGIDDPYEVPKHPEITLDTSHATVEDLTNEIYDRIKTMGFL